MTVELVAQLSRWPSWSKAPVSGTGPKGRAWVRIPFLTIFLYFRFSIARNLFLLL